MLPPPLLYARAINDIFSRSRVFKTQSKSRFISKTEAKLVEEDKDEEKVCNWVVAAAS